MSEHFQKNGIYIGEENRKGHAYVSAKNANGQ